MRTAEGIDVLVAEVIESALAQVLGGISCPDFEGRNVFNHDAAQYSYGTQAESNSGTNANLCADPATILQFNRPAKKLHVARLPVVVTRAKVSAL